MSWSTVSYVSHLKNPEHICCSIVPNRHWYGVSVALIWRKCMVLYSLTIDLMGKSFGSGYVQLWEKRIYVRSSCLPFAGISGRREIEEFLLIYYTHLKSVFFFKLISMYHVEQIYFQIISACAYQMETQPMTYNLQDRSGVQTECRRTPLIVRSDTLVAPYFTLWV